MTAAHLTMLFSLWCSDTADDRCNALRPNALPSERIALFLSFSCAHTFLKDLGSLQGTAVGGKFSPLSMPCSPGILKTWA